MYFMNDDMIQSVVDRYLASIENSTTTYISSDQADLVESTQSYASTFFDETGIAYQQVLPQIDDVALLKLEDPLIGYFLHFLGENSYHIFMDKKLHDPLDPRCVFWYLMTLKAEQRVVPIEALYYQFGKKMKLSPKQRHWYEARTLKDGRLLVKGDHDFCRKAIANSDNALLGSTHYLIMAYVDHDQFMRKIYREQ